jgi:hypothetical protein
MMRLAKPLDTIAKTNISDTNRFAMVINQIRLDSLHLFQSIVNVSHYIRRRRDSTCRKKYATQSDAGAFGNAANTILAISATSTLYPNHSIFSPSYSPTVSSNPIPDLLVDTRKKE